jgi:kynurenine formamidase
MSRFIDLSVYIENNEHTDHPGGSPKVTYRTHKQTAGGLAHFFEGLQPEQLPDGEGWAVETITLSTHNGTHMDAPWHFHSTTDHGRVRAPAIDETPLEYCFKPGVKLDFRHLPDGHLVSAAEIEAELGRIGHDLKPLDIVLVNTSAGAVFGQPGYVGPRLWHGPGSNPVPHGTRGACRGYRRLVLGRAFQSHRETVAGNPRSVHRLGRPQGGP